MVSALWASHSASMSRPITERQPQSAIGIKALANVYKVFPDDPTLDKEVWLQAAGIPKMETKLQRELKEI
jgi:hypothetical protein